MIKTIFQVFSGCLSFLFYVINTISWALPMFLIAILKFLIPIDIMVNFFRLIMNHLAGFWIFCNNINQKIFSCVNWDVVGIEKLSMDNYYMVIANHQSWVDVLVLQKIFHKKIPFLKFFIKKGLIWIPILGQTWWALEFPFVKRYSRKKIKNNPNLVDKDLKFTREYCKKLTGAPISIMSFVEGTRFTPEKHLHQKSKYKHLLRAKAGGLAFVMATIGDKLNQIIDVTIAYPNNKKSFWAFLCGQINEIRVRVKIRSIEDNMIGNYLENSQYRIAFQNWLNNLWLEKDKCLSDLINK